MSIVQEIEEIVEYIHNRTAEAIETMKRDTEEVNKGTIVVGAAGVAFKKILQSAKKATKQIQDISDLMNDMPWDRKNICYI